MFDIGSLKDGDSCGIGFGHFCSVPLPGSFRQSILSGKVMDTLQSMLSAKEMNTISSPRNGRIVAL
jgi:hypothetical protein